MSIIAKHACTVSFLDLVIGGAYGPFFRAFLTNSSNHTTQIAFTLFFDSEDPYYLVEMETELEHYTVSVELISSHSNITVYTTNITLKSATMNTLVFSGILNSTQYPFTIVHVPQPPPQNNKKYSSQGCFHGSPGSPPLICKYTHINSGKVYQTWTLNYLEYAFNNSFPGDEYGMAYEFSVYYAKNQTLILDYPGVSIVDTISIWYLVGSLTSYPGFGISDFN